MSRRWKMEDGRWRWKIALSICNPLSSIIYPRSSTRWVILLTVLTSTLLCLTIWTLTFYTTGDRLDCRGGETAFCALRVRNGAGVSVQWDTLRRLPPRGSVWRPATAWRVTVWQWGPGGLDNRRLWPRE